jgi:hypothetical protein
MHGPCIPHGRDEKVCKTLVRKPCHGWENDIKMNIQEVCCADEIWAYLAWDRFLWQSALNTVNEPSGSIQDVKFLD